jgi:hypothetical protein
MDGCGERALRLERHQLALVGDRLAGLARELGVNFRRAAVRDRVADDEVAVSHFPPLTCSPTSS